MNPRSALAGTAALLLAAVAIPESIPLLPTPAIAQELSAEAKAAMDDTTPASALDKKVLRQRVKALREAIKSGAVKTGTERQAAVQKIKAYREVLQAGRKQTGDQAAQKPAAESEDQSADDGAQSDASSTEQVQKKQPEATAETAAAAQDDRPASELETPDLRKRARALRAEIQSGKLKGAERKAAAQKLRADRAELKKRRESKGTDQSTQKATDQNAQQDGQVDPDDPAGMESQDEAEEPASEPTAPGQGSSLLSDKKKAAELTDQDLRKRVNDTRAALAAKNMPAAQQRDLRKRLAEDRKVLRERVAVRNEQSTEATNETTQGNEVNTSINNDGGVVNNNTTINNTVNNVNVIVQDQTPADKLNERQLNQRIRTIERELRAKRVDSTKIEIANRILIEDRRVLRDRMIRDRTRREAELRRLRDRNELRIDFNVAVAPPPIIAAAEVDYPAIETQLIAPPRRVPPRRYSFEQIVENPDVRESMPGIDIDTINFDFGSAEVRPEEVERLDRVGEALEKIVAARPDEVFVVEGHTDAVGTDTANMELSKARADSVKAALTEYFLIQPDNIRTVGLGERYLKIPTEEPEEENRRVTIRRITPLLTGEAG